MGEAQKGQLVAVMGSSGCGKTSFLDCLSMRNQAFRGNIFVNGKEIDGRYFSLAGKRVDGWIDSMDWLVDG